MPITFNQMVRQALAEAPTVSAADVHERMLKDPATLIIEVRDAADIPVTGIIPEAINISLGTHTKPITKCLKNGETQISELVRARLSWSVNRGKWLRLPVSS